jgi:formylglycine-generating enzyme required for sulfatase activity
MRRLTRAALIACSVLLGAACGLSLSGAGSGGVSASDDGGPDSGATEAATSEDASDSGTDDVTADRSADAAACPDAWPHPALVNVGAFCIDATEVSITMFLGFLMSNASVAPPPVEGCEWKTAYTYADAGWIPSGMPAIVDWCDAWAYCHWAGKRLCGGIGAADLPGPAEADDPTKSQWNYACTGGDPKHKYPYGTTYDASTCGGPLHEANMGAACEGAFPGVFDMSGNVAEWIDSCASTDKTANCLVRGGSYLSTKPDQFACAGGPSSRRDQIPPATGFRCCAP